MIQNIYSSLQPFVPEDLFCGFGSCAQERFGSYLAEYQYLLSLDFREDGLCMDRATFDLLRCRLTHLEIGVVRAFDYISWQAANRVLNVAVLTLDANLG